jgi:hypothetical protein
MVMNEYVLAAREQANLLAKRIDWIAACADAVSPFAVTARTVRITPRASGGNC